VRSRLCFCSIEILFLVIATSFQFIKSPEGFGASLFSRARYQPLNRIKRATGQRRNHFADFQDVTGVGQVRTPKATKASSTGPLSSLLASQATGGAKRRRVSITTMRGQMNASSLKLGQTKGHFRSQVMGFVKHWGLSPGLFTAISSRPARKVDRNDESEWY
jgi:hypothetical protein